MKILKYIQDSIAIDCLLFRSRFFLFFFNLFPDFYTLRFISNIFLKLGGTKLPLFNCYVRTPFYCSKLSNLYIEPGVFINKGCRVEGTERVIIGKGTQIGPRSMIESVNHVGDNLEDEHLPVEIGQGNWLGAGVIMTPGVTTCKNVKIAAGAVVSKSIHEEGLYGGVPAKKLKSN